jgi:hypothetical protein
MWSNPYISSNWSWKLPLTSVPIHIALQIRKWQHFFISLQIRRDRQIRSLHHPAISVPIHKISKIGRWNFLSQYSNPPSTSNFVMRAFIQISSNLERTRNLAMTSSYIICANPNSSFNWSWNLPLTSYLIPIAIHIKSWQQYFTTCWFPQSNSY